MELRKLTEWNPWWEDPTSLTILEGTPRPRYDDLLQSIEIQEVTILTGVRRCGKSTLMYQMIRNLFKKDVAPEQILFINLEDTKLNEDSLDTIYETYRIQVNPDKKAYVFLDEIHKRDGWESWVRKKYDLKSNDKFVLSGSCSHLLKKEYATLLTGRNLTFEVSPLCFAEYLHFKKIAVHPQKIKKGVLQQKTKRDILRTFHQYLHEGGFPEMVFKPELYRMQLLGQYFDDILYKDIVDRYTLNSKKTKDLALYFMTNFTGILSLRKIRGALGISYDTIKDYLSHFEESYLFFTLDHFSYKFKEQKTRPSKIYCVDQGLRTAVSFTFSKDEGKLAENIVFLQLRRKKKEMYYWEDGVEVDFVVKEKDQALTLIDVTYTDDITDDTITSLQTFKKKFRDTARIRKILLITKDTERKIGNVQCIPLWKWLLQ
jgi:uncharacterized protein